MNHTEQMSEYTMGILLQSFCCERVNMAKKLMSSVCLSYLSISLVSVLSSNLMKSEMDYIAL